MQSNRALQDQLAKYDAFPVEIRQSAYGYKVVTFSCGPSLRLSVMVATMGSSDSEAADLGIAVLTRQTGQKVTT
jgi:hypothetical protein